MQQIFYTTLVMKKSLIFIAAIFCLIASSQSQTEASVLRDADRLVSQRQYATAYSLLDRFDPTNDIPSILLKKEEIMLDYFVQSINHMVFSLQDLKPGESLDSIRSHFTIGQMIPFMADSLLRRLIDRHPADCALLCGYARYYQALLDDYDMQLWDIYVDTTVFYLLRRAAKPDCHCAEASYQVGLRYNRLDLDDSASHYYRRTLAICDTHWHAHYNLGVNAYGDEKTAEAIIHFRRAYHGYTDHLLKADAARALGIIYSDHLRQTDSALHYLQAAHRLTPFDFGNAANLLTLLVEEKLPCPTALIDTCWQAAFNGDQTMNDAIHLTNIFANSDNQSQIEDFLTKGIPTAETDYERGLMHLMLGLYVYTDPAKALPHLEAAHKLFTADGAPDDFLSQLRDQINTLTP